MFLLLCSLCASIIDAYIAFDGLDTDTLSSTVFIEAPVGYEGSLIYKEWDVKLCTEPSTTVDYTLLNIRKRANGNSSNLEFTVENKKLQGGWIVDLSNFLGDDLKDLHISDDDNLIFSDKFILEDREIYWTLKGGLIGSYTILTVVECADGEYRVDVKDMDDVGR